MFLWIMLSIPTLGNREIKVEVQLASFLEYDTDTFGHVCPDTENDNSGSSL